MAEKSDAVASAPGTTSTLATRWLGVGLASALSVATLVLAATGHLAVYVGAGAVWFASIVAVVTLGFAVWSCTMPLGVEQSRSGAKDDRMLNTVATVVGGVIATLVVLAALLLPAPAASDGLLSPTESTSTGGVQR